MNIGLVGSVDSGKTTLISVLSTGNLDDGRGGSRGNVLIHKHELLSGCTSSINIISMSSGINLIDLPGHEAYLNTTLTGLTKYKPDYVLVIVDANKAEKCKTSFDQLKICRRFGLQCAIIFTKTDTAGDLLKSSIEHTKLMAKRLGYRFFINMNQESDKFINQVELFAAGNRQLLPYFCVSNTTGDNIEQLRIFLSLLKPIPFMQTQRVKWLTDQGINVMFDIYKIYRKEIGMIFFGEVRYGSLKVGDDLYFGPFASQFDKHDGNYIKIRIKSIHNHAREPVDCLNEREQGCIAFRLNSKMSQFLKPKNDIKIKKSKLIVNKNMTFRQILVRLDIFEGSITINSGYMPYIICDHLSGNAKIVASPKYPIRGGDIARVLLQFDRPQFIYPNTKLLFRDGRVRGAGIIEDVMNLTNEQVDSYQFPE